MLVIRWTCLIPKSEHTTKENVSTDLQTAGIIRVAAAAPMGIAV